jgi:hypothetical protein
MIMNREELINAALEHQSKFETCDDEGTLVGFANGMHKQSYESFIAGAEWQAKQLSWISVEERLPEENQEYLVVFNSREICVALYNNKSWLIYGTGVTYNVVAYMPIPSFDQILEANKDVLQRIKEKGD